MSRAEWTFTPTANDRVVEVRRVDSRSEPARFQSFVRRKARMCPRCHACMAQIAQGDTAYREQSGDSRQYLAGVVFCVDCVQRPSEVAQ